MDQGKLYNEAIDRVFVLKLHLAVITDGLSASLNEIELQRIASVPLTIEARPQAILLLVVQRRFLLTG